MRRMAGRGNKKMAILASVQQRSNPGLANASTSELEVLVMTGIWLSRAKLQVTAVQSGCLEAMTRLRDTQSLEGW
jgi:hypothetical protein